MRTRLVVSFFICFLLQACSGASTTKTNGVSNTSGNDQAGCIALDTIGIDGAVEKFVWNEEDGIGFLIQDNSYLDFIKSSFTSRPVFAMQAADGRITYSTEDLPTPPLPETTANTFLMSCLVRSSLGSLWAFLFWPQPSHSGSVPHLDSSQLLI